MIIKVILGHVNIADVDVYFTLLRDWLYSQSLFRMALLLHCTPYPFYPSSPAGGPLWGEQGSLNLYDETGVEHEKNVGRPRAVAVAPRESLSEALFCIVFLLGTKFPDFRAKQIALIVISDSNPPCSRLAKVTSLYRYCVYQN